jgi:hypothetical protein
MLRYVFVAVVVLTVICNSFGLYVILTDHPSDWRQYNWHTKIYEEGERAKLEGIPSTANPCTGNPEKARCWLSGWIQQKMREEGRLGKMEIHQEDVIGTIRIPKD